MEGVKKEKCNTIGYTFGSNGAFQRHEIDFAMLQPAAEAGQEGALPRGEVAGKDVAARLADKP